MRHYSWAESSSHSDLADATLVLSLWITVFLLCMFPPAEPFFWYFLVNLLPLLTVRRISWPMSVHPSVAFRWRKIDKKSDDSGGVFYAIV